MLHQSEVALYLLQREYISGASITDGDLQVMDVSRHNRNFKVISQRGPSYLLKQGASRTDGRSTLAYESDIYQRLSAVWEKHSLAPYLPRHYGYDPDHDILILELVGDVLSFQEHHARYLRFSALRAAALGQALSEFHRLASSAAAREQLRDLPIRTPFALSLHRPTIELFRDVSAANLQLIRIVQNTPEFPESLERLQQGWRVDGLIHNDLKWDNCLTASHSVSRVAPSLKIFDWEFAGLGDSGWDVGAIFSNYLSFWLSTIPVTGEDPPDRFLDLARCPLGRMQPAIRSYWESYSRAMGFDRAKAEEVLLRAIRYAAARLIQTGFEQMQRSVRLTGNVVCLLQLSLNMLRKPYEAIAHLAGISLQGGVA
jgi:hypothetical protein